MPNENTSKRPSHYVYAVTKRGEDDKAFWTRIGACWPTRDGKGFSIVLDLVPINGASIAMREPQPDESAK